MPFHHSPTQKFSTEKMKMKNNVQGCSALWYKGYRLWVILLRLISYRGFYLGVSVLLSPGLTSMASSHPPCDDADWQVDAAGFRKNASSFCSLLSVLTMLCAYTFAKNKKTNTVNLKHSQPEPSRVFHNKIFSCTSHVSVVHLLHLIYLFPLHSQISDLCDGGQRIKWWEENRQCSTENHHHLDTDLPTYSRKENLQEVDLNMHCINVIRFKDCSHLP